MLKFLKFDNRLINIEYIQEVTVMENINNSYNVYIRVFGYSSPYVLLKQCKTEEEALNARLQLIKKLAGKNTNIIQFEG